MPPLYFEIRQFDAGAYRHRDAVGGLLARCGRARGKIVRLSSRDNSASGADDEILAVAIIEHGRADDALAIGDERSDRAFFIHRDAAAQDLSPAFVHHDGTGRALFVRNKGRRARLDHFEAALGLAPPVDADALEVRVKLLAHVVYEAPAVLLVRQVVVVIADHEAPAFAAQILVGLLEIGCEGGEDGTAALAQQAFYHQCHLGAPVRGLERGIGAGGAASDHQYIGLEYLDHDSPPFAPSPAEIFGGGCSLVGAKGG